MVLRRSPGTGWRWWCVGWATLLLLSAAPAVGWQRPGRTDWVSVPLAGVPNLASRPAAYARALSDDGRYVAVDTDQTNLFPDDTNNAFDILLRDRLAGDTELISVAQDGGLANGSSIWPAMSGDARFVAYHSDASNLVPDDLGGRTDVFVRDRPAGRTIRVSVASDGAEANGASLEARISANGRYVTFESTAQNLVTDDTNLTNDVFLHDLATGTTERISLATDGTQGLRPSRAPAPVSDDGRLVAFVSESPNLVAADTNGVTDVFARDRQAGTTRLVSIGVGGLPANGSSFEPAMTPDGRSVAFWSRASNLVPQDTNRLPDVFVHDLETGRTEMVSVATGGAQGNGTSGFAALSPDGRYLGFNSLATNLVPGDVNGAYDVFLRDRLLGTTERVSLTSDGAEPNSDSYFPQVGADGASVSFYSFADNLIVPDATGKYPDAFVRDRGLDLSVGELRADSDGDAIDVRGWAAFGGSLLARVEDPLGDSSPPAEAAGGEITGMSVSYGAEDDALVLSLELASLPTAGGGAAPLCGDIIRDGCLANLAAGIGYIFELDSGSVRHEIRAERAGATAPGTDGAFSLQRCEVTCTQVATLRGGFGTEGPRISVAVPIASLGLPPAQAIEVGASAAGADDTDPFDIVELGSISVPRPEVFLAPSAEVLEAPDGAVPTGSGGVFTTQLSKDAFGDRVWAVACLAGTCGAPVSTSIAS